MTVKNKILFLTVNFLFVIFSNKLVFATTEIGDEIVSTSEVIDNDDIVFAGSIEGTLNHDQALNRRIKTVSTDNDGIGVIDLNSDNNLIINGDIGSASKRINQIIFSQISTLQISGSLFTSNAVGVDGSAFDDGEIHFSGDNSTVSATLGTSAHKLGTITAEGVNVTFNKNLFSSFFTVSSNKSATLSSSITSADLGATQLFANSSLNLQSNASVSTLATASSSTITIGAGKQLTGSGALSFDGTLNVGILRSDSSTAVVASSSTVNLVDGLEINFDYSDATFIKESDEYNFLTSTGTLTANETLLNANLTDTSILLSPSITAVAGSPNVIQVTQNIDETTIDKLTQNDLVAASFLIDNVTANDETTDLDSARTALFKISTQSELEEALDTLQVDNSNMLQRTAINISSSIENIFEYRLQSLNYQHSKANRVRDLIRAKNTNRDEVALIKSSGLWGEVFGATAKQNDITETSTTSSTTTTTKGYDVNFGGITFGLDKIFKGDDSNAIWGGALSYSKASAESRALSKQKTDINSYQLSLYNHNIARSGLGFFSENFLNVGYNQYSSERTIDLTTYQSVAKADFSAIQYGAKTSIGYNFKMGEKAIFAPAVGIKYFGLQMQDYQETNSGGLGLKVENDYFDLTTSEIGFRITGVLGPRVEPQINVAWLHNLNSGGATSNSTFINGIETQTKIQNTGIDLDANILNAGAQINLRTSHNTSLMFKYDLQKSANFTSHLGSMKFAWAF